VNLDAITLGRVMIHDVPRGGSETPPTFTDAPVELDSELRDYFRRKLKASLETRGVAVVVDPDGDPTVRVAVTAILRDPAALAARSREIALRLAEAQSAVNPEGLLVVIEIDLDDERAVSVMKLEREQGIRFEIKKVDGAATVDLELLRQLTLTNKTRVFKTALFQCSDVTDPMRLQGRVSDNQRGLDEGRGVADFYLGTFLGCALAQNPARTTQQFASAVTHFVNESALTDEKKGRYALALLAELQSNNLDVSAHKFVTEHIAAEDRLAVNDRLREEGVDPATVFQKDASLVRLDKLRIDFESGIVLVGATDQMRSHVRIRGAGEPSGVEVTDNIASMSGR
jgi:hypothetical protein